MVNAQLISPFVFTTQIVQSLFFFKSKFQAGLLSVTEEAGLCRAWSENPKGQFSGILAHVLPVFKGNTANYNYVSSV